MKPSLKPAILATLVAAAVASPAFATGDGGDNGMTPWYGDSWANVQSRQANAVDATAVPSLQAQEEKAPATEAWAHTRDNVRARAAHVRESTSNAFHRMTGTTTTTTNDAAVGTTTGGSVTTGTTTTSTGTMGALPNGPLGSGSNTGTVDPTGVGAATMGGSPYGGNQDPARLPSSSSRDVRPSGR